MNHLLNVVVNTIQDGTLINHQDCQLFEDGMQVRDRWCNLIDLLISKIGALLHFLQILQLSLTKAIKINIHPTWYVF